MASVIGIYHKDCIDGTASAAVVLRKYPDALLCPLPHSYKLEDFVDILVQITPETQIYTVDCMFGAREFLERGLMVTTIDHHADKKDELAALKKKYPEYAVVFDEKKSGASLSWQHFFPEEPEPKLVSLIEDVDLWLWRYGKESRDASAFLWLLRNDPASMLAHIEGPLAPILEKGALLSGYADTEIEFQCTIEPIRIRVGARQVAAHNITTHQSASGNKLSEKSGAAVAMFTIQDARVKISFRSKDGQNPSALELAASLGGGGHPNAAGATVSLADFLKMIVL